MAPYCCGTRFLQPEWRVSFGNIKGCGLNPISYPDMSEALRFGLGVAIFTKRAHLSTFSFRRRRIIHSIKKYKLNLKKPPLKKRASTHTC
jgi:hypothetical protein